MRVRSKPLAHCDDAQPCQEHPCRSPTEPSARSLLDVSNWVRQTGVEHFGMPLDRTCEGVRVPSIDHISWKWSAARTSHRRQGHLCRKVREVLRERGVGQGRTLGLEQGGERRTEAAVFQPRHTGSVVRLVEGRGCIDPRCRSQEALIGEAGRSCVFTHRIGLAFGKAWPERPMERNRGKRGRAVLHHGEVCHLRSARRRSGLHPLAARPATPGQDAKPPAAGSVCRG
mmetsp:Transcript_30699/g.64095  ORF Transcript_30699/g.64095 Transcript_30699/m.64095 type:complete len:228 (-) Transcript_30699:3-686(-)